MFWEEDLQFLSSHLPTSFYHHNMDNYTEDTTINHYIIYRIENNYFVKNHSIQTTLIIDDLFCWLLDFLTCFQKCLPMSTHEMSIKY